MNPELLVAAKKALDKCKMQLMKRKDTAFFTTICFSLKHSFNDQIPTACTNGLWVQYNPTFFLSLPPGQQMFVVLHETLHVCYMHMVRRGERDPEKYNRAGDYVINATLERRGIELIPGVLHDYDYYDMNTEQVYNLLPNVPPQSNPMAGDVEYKDPTQKEGATGELEQKIQDILVRAAIQSKASGDMPGTIPGDIQMYLDALLNPLLPWNRILARYSTSAAKNDYSMKRPNRRHFPAHHLPSLYSHTLKNITIAIDASGSMDDKEFKQVISESYTIMKRLKPQKITLLQFDTRITHIDTVRSAHDFLGLTFSGRGGTNITPVVEWANEYKPELLLVFSDGGFRFRDTDRTRVETIWLIHNLPRFEAPFGRVIHYQQ